MERVIIFAILAGVSGIVLIVYWSLKHEENRLKLKAGAAAQDASNGELQKEVASLRDRVAVLEKLVTDDDRRLAHDIEKLSRSDAARPTA